MREWQHVGSARDGVFEVESPEEGVAYEAVVVPRTKSGARGDERDATAVTFAARGQNRQPDDVTNLEGAYYDGAVHLKWDCIGADISHFQIRVVTSTASTSWVTGYVWAECVRASRYHGPVPSPTASIIFAVRAVNTSGVASDAHAAVTVTVATTDFSLATSTQEPTWAGTKSGCTVASNELVQDAGSDTATYVYQATYGSLTDISLFAEVAAAVNSGFDLTVDRLALELWRPYYTRRVVDDLSTDDWEGQENLDWWSVDAQAQILDSLYHENPLTIPSDYWSGVSIKCESRSSSNGGSSWTDWIPVLPVRYEQINAYEVRVTMTVPDANQLRLKLTGLSVHVHTPSAGGGATDLIGLTDTPGSNPSNDQTFMVWDAGGAAWEWAGAGIAYDIAASKLTVKGLQVSGSATELDMGTNRIKSVADATADTDGPNLGQLGGVLDYKNVFNGACVESIDIAVVESTGAVKLQLQADGGGDLTFWFGGTQYTLDCTPVLEVTLTAGTDIAPQINYVYVTESGGVLSLVNSTSAFPSTSHAPIATVFSQSAASLATDGALKVHAWTDHVYTATGNGHLSHLNAKFRAGPATWVSGVAAADYSAGHISTTAGVIYQLHTHTFPSRDTALSDPIWVVNDSDAAYSRIGKLSTGGVDKLADGTAIGNNKYVNLVLWGSVNEDETDCKLYMNLPDGQYSTSADADADVNNTANFSIPTDFVGTGFLIARYVLQYSTAGGGAFTQSSKVDLRGLVPSTTPGGGAITDHGQLAGLTDDDHVGYTLAAGTRAFTGDQSLGSNNLTSVAAGTAAGHAAIVDQTPNLVWVKDLPVHGAGIWFNGSAYANSAPSVLNNTDDDAATAIFQFGDAVVRGFQFQFRVCGDLDVAADIQLLLNFNVAGAVSASHTVTYDFEGRTRGDNVPHAAGGTLFTPVSKTQTIGSDGSNHTGGDLLEVDVGVVIPGGTLTDGDYVTCTIKRDTATDTYTGNTQLMGATLLGTRKALY